MKITEYWNPAESTEGVLLEMDRMSFHEFGRDVYARAIELAAQSLASRIVAERGQEILAKCDMQAVANLSVAEAAVSVRDTIHHDMKSLKKTIGEGLAKLDEPVYEGTWYGGRRRVR